jgi:hypothetical protein
MNLIADGLNVQAAIAEANKQLPQTLGHYQAVNSGGFYWNVIDLNTGSVFVNGCCGLYKAMSAIRNQLEKEQEFA